MHDIGQPVAVENVFADLPGMALDGNPDRPIEHEQLPLVPA